MTKRRNPVQEDRTRYAGVSAARGFVARRAGYPHIAMSEPTPTVLPDPPLEPRRPGEAPTVDIPEPPDPAEPWNEPEPPEPPEPGHPPELPPDDDLSNGRGYALGCS